MDFPDPTIQTSDALKNRFRVYVHNTTGDFLHESGQSSYGYYRYTLGLQTIGDFSTAGDHCSAVAGAEDKAYDWILGRTQLPVLDEYPRWQRIALLNANDMAVDRYGVLWASVQSNPGEISVFSTRNDGKDWQKFGVVPGNNTDLEAVGDYIFVGTRDGLYRSHLSAANFKLIGGPIIPNGIVSDGKDRLFNYVTMKVSRNFGDTWESFGLNEIKNEVAPGMDRLSNILAENEGFNFIDHAANIPATYQSRLANLPVDFVRALADDGERWWVLAKAANDPAYYFRMFVTSDLGLTWTEIALPPSLKAGETTVDRVESLPTGEILVHGGPPYAAGSWITSDKGVSWKRVRGLETVSWAAEVVGTKDGKRLYAEDQGAVFSLLRSATPDPVVIQGVPLVPSLFIGTLILPAVKVEGTYYQAELKATSLPATEFTLASASPLKSPPVPASNLPEFAGGTLSVPVMQYGDRQFAVTMELIGRNPLRFRAVSTAEIIK